MQYRNSPFWALCITIAVTQLAYSVAVVPPSTTSSILKRILTPVNGRIINGTEALQNNTKYQVSIRNRILDLYKYGSGHICSGSLISNNVVLSAAACFVDNGFANGTYMDDDFFIVAMGSVNRYEKDDNTLVFKIKKTIKFKPVFNLKTLENDLALVILDGSVPADHPTIQPVTLNGGLLQGGAVCQLAGWGATGNASDSTKLLTVDAPIVPFDTCPHKTNNGLKLCVGMLCAGYLQGKSGACLGDAGGPLVCNDLQTGITSWSSACAVANKPTVFTDVAYYKDWILSKVAENKASLPKFVGTITGGGGSTGGSDTCVDNGPTGNGTTGDGGNSTTGDGDSEGDGSMSTYKNSIFLVSVMVVFNIILSKF